MGSLAHCSSNNDAEENLHYLSYNLHHILDFAYSV